MIKTALLTLTLALLSGMAKAQDFGLSFSYFIPKNGYFSTPISPFSIRGIGVNLNNFLALETGVSLYRMSGLNVKDLPFESKAPLVGPNFTIFIPAELVIELKGNGVQFDIKGGGFFFYGFDQKINYGNMDRAMREFYQLEIVNADLTYSNKPGFGYHAGVELTFYIMPQVGISLECNYLIGQSSFPLEGTFKGVNGNGVETVTINYPDAKIDLTGLEFSIGLLFSSGGGQNYKKRRR
ncbi:MAG: hypothetical protein KF687_09170 [Cyclobacteriaceae bacterium]|nr:hypothetical protein [Cyclobacteriaceae bacterium]